MRILVASTEIVDILAAAGIQTPDISILSDKFLLEVQQMEKKNLGLEALRKLLNHDIRSRTRTNVVESRAFTERLEDAIARYHANAITTAEVLQELIQLAKDLRAARERGEANGMTQEEIAFYDALAENESAMELAHATLADQTDAMKPTRRLVHLVQNSAVTFCRRHHISPKFHRHPEQYPVADHQNQADSCSDRYSSGTHISYSGSIIRRQ